MVGSSLRCRLTADQRSALFKLGMKISLRAMDARPLQQESIQRIRVLGAGVIRGGLQAASKYLAYLLYKCL
jgi:hypothetical protein